MEMVDGYGGWCESDEKVYDDDGKRNEPDDDGCK